jgi:hypothetical protein
MAPEAESGSRAAAGDERVRSSDQLPEDGPAQLVPDDAAGARDGAARESGRRQARAANRSRHGPGDPREEDEGRAR